MIFYLTQILSNEMLSYIAYEELTRLVSLPAGIRLIAVVIYRWIGFLGIVLGSVFSSIFSGENLLFESLVLGLISGVTAYTALLVWQWHYRIGKNLEGLTLRLIIALVLISATISSCIRYLSLVSNDPLTSFLSVFLIGFTGDVLGCFIVLYVIKGGLYLFKRYSSN
jgi:hypothetical protein